MTPEEFEKYYTEITKAVLSDYHIARKVIKQILEEIYQKGKDDKFKDIGYLDVDEFYHDENEFYQSDTSMKEAKS